VNEIFMTRPTLVADDVVVRIDYTLTLSDGEIVDSSADEGPLEFLQGHGQIIPGLEEGLAGMAVGEEKEIVVTPDFAYGEYDPDAFDLIPLEEFPDDFELEPGMALELFDEDTGEPSEAYIAEVRKDGVVVDFNHPLAGETLYFEVKVVGLRAAAPEELDHGNGHDADHTH